MKNNIRKEEIKQEETTGEKVEVKKKKRYLSFVIVATIYVLIVLWVKCYWWLLGLIVIFDQYITQKVNWTFWKKRDGNNSALVEWLDAIIFAVFFVTIINIIFFQNYRIPTPSMEKTLLVGDHLFVSKVSYGPKLPNTPLALPFMQNVIPGTTKQSWSNLIIKPYRRAKGFGKVQRFDPFVFNFPAGDTVALEEQATSYYEIVRRTAREMRANDINNLIPEKSQGYYMSQARNQTLRNATIVYRPVDRRDSYVKRCVGIPNDTIEIRQGVLYVNGVKEPDSETRQSSYVVITNGTSINPRVFERLNISKDDQNMRSTSVYYLFLTPSAAESIASLNNVVSVQKIIANKNAEAPYIFPHQESFKWNEDNYGPLWIPSKGSTVKIDTSNIALYERIIDVYEENDLRVVGSDIYINGVKTDSYTFKMDYYWAMGDNRHNSADSRYWGFVPEDHVVGKPKFIWLSLDQDKSGLKRIRVKRFFKSIK